MEQFLADNWWVILVLAIWTLPWKGVALWKAVKLNHQAWFIALLILNTLAILEILYIFSLNRFDLGSAKALAFLKEKFGQIKR